ncbi:MAG: putative transport system permease protein [Solirubrobacterales bacterium]|nr:putative transport system permease protein [Solirubrobacterales bacterium]
MRLGALLHLYRVRLRSRLVTELLAIAGLAVGVALIFAALIANASLSGAVRELSEGIVGKAEFQISARGASGFDQRLFERVAGLPDATAAPLAEARVNLRGPNGRTSVLLVGGDPRFGDVGGSLLHNPKLASRSHRWGLILPAPVARQIGARLGTDLIVETGARTVRVPLTGTLGSGDIGEMAESPVALAPLPLVQDLAGMRGRISRVFVDAKPGRERSVKRSLERIAGDRVNLAPADQELLLFERAAYPTSRSTALFSSLSGLVGFLFALNAMLLSLPQRQRLIDDLRIAGYAPTSLIQIALLDALLLGVAAAAAGLLLGAAGSRLLFDAVPDYLTSAFAIGSQRIVTWQSAVLAGGAGLLAAGFAVVLPLRTLLAPRQAPELLPSTSRRQGLAFAAGVALVGVTVAIAFLAPATSLVGMVALLSALLLVLQVGLRLAAAAFELICRRMRSPVAILAALELRAGSARIRTLALAATGAVAVFAAVSVGGARADLQRGLDGIAENLDGGADVWVSFRGPTSIFGTTAFELPPGQLPAIERLHGVEAVTMNRGAYLDVGDDRVWVLGPAPSRVGAVLRGQVEVGGLPPAVRLLRKSGWITLSRGLASDLAVSVGDPVDLPLPVPSPLRVAALTSNFGWPGGAIVIGAPDFSRAWGSPAVSALGIRLDPAVPSAPVVAAVGSILGKRGALQVESAAARMQRQRSASRAGLARLSQISVLILISSVLAMAASMAGLVWQRRPTLAALKVHGLSEGELWRALLLEAVLLLGTGCAVGALFGLIGQVLLDRALEAITGFPVLYEVAWISALSAISLLTAAAVAALAVPGWLAVRVHPGPRSSIS